ncbi:MAG: 30S ribosomal protein S21 [bacterium]|nr:30S ribosomal protein S21 [bacterium]
MAKQEKRPGESIDSVLRKFKRKLKNEGTLQHLKQKEYFEKPSESKKRKKRAAIRRNTLRQEADRW